MHNFSCMVVCPSECLAVSMELVQILLATLIIVCRAGNGQGKLLSRL